MIATQDSMFVSADGRCQAWVTVPQGTGPHPAVVLVHGFGATHEMALPHYERRFAEAGLVVVSFDYRFNGASPGEPRQQIRVKHLLADVEAAVDFTRSHPAVDRDRVALWGTSFGAGHAMVVAARRPEVAAVVANCPMIDARNAARRLGATHLLRLVGPIADDAVRGVLGLRRRYFPIVGEPGERALITTPGAKAGWLSLVPEGIEWDNRCTAAVGIDFLRYRAARAAPRIRCPFLVCVSDHENLMDPAIAVRAAGQGPRGRAIHYPADHFQVYHPPLVEQIVDDQITFLRGALMPDAQG